MKSEKVFTKWDLVVVLGCVGFIFLNLAAIGIRGRSKAKEMVCANNIKEQVRAQLLFAADNDGKFPANAVEYPNRARYRNSTGTGKDWYGALKKSVYLPESKIMLCPVLKTLGYDSSSTNLGWLSSNPIQYGAWDWEKNPLASSIPAGQTPGDILIGYAWFANWTSGGTQIFKFSWYDLAGKTCAVDTPAWPKSLNDCKSNNAMITHSIMQDLGINTFYDDSHRNSVSALSFTQNNASQVQPVGYGDGHVGVIPKNKIEPRAEVGVGTARPKIIYY